MGSQNGFDHRSHVSFPASLARPMPTNSSKRTWQIHLRLPEAACDPRTLGGIVVPLGLDLHATRNFTLCREQKQKNKTPTSLNSEVLSTLRISIEDPEAETVEPACQSQQSTLLGNGAGQTPDWSSGPHASVGSAPRPCW